MEGAMLISVCEIGICERHITHAGGDCADQFWLPRQLRPARRGFVSGTVVPHVISVPRGRFAWGVAIPSIRNRALPGLGKGAADITRPRAR